MRELAENGVAFFLAHTLNAERRQRSEQHYVVEFPYWRWGTDTFSSGPLRPISTHVSGSISLGHGYASVTGYAVSVTTGYVL